MLMMSAPMVVAYRIPAMTVPKVPAPFWFSTLTAIRLAPGAMLAVRKAFEATTDATWVPWELSSPHGGHTPPHDPPVNWFGMNAKLRVRSTRPCISGWVSSMPVSTIATLAPCPRCPVDQASGAWYACRYTCQLSDGWVCDVIRTYGYVCADHLS